MFIQLTRCLDNEITLINTDHIISVQNVTYEHGRATRVLTTGVDGVYVEEDIDYFLRELEQK